LAGVDGVRALAALSVLVWHVWAHSTLTNKYGVSVSPFTKIFANMQAGVAVFFVVSGFLLFRPFARALLHDEALPSLRTYFRNRALRILPAYWAILLLVTLLFQRGLLERPLQFLANMAFLQSYVPSYMPTWEHGYGIAPAWSLCVEVVFYLALPLLVLFTRRVRGAGHLAAVGRPRCRSSSWRDWASARRHSPKLTGSVRCSKTASQRMPTGSPSA